MEIQGIRLFKQPGEEDFLWRISQTPNGYGTTNGKYWYCTTPNGLFGNLGAHQVVEHEDGTITVSPSILVSSGNRSTDTSWHGYLKKGIWSDC